MSDDAEIAAADRTAQNLARAIAAIDAQFGQGYAAANPALVAAFLQSASIEHAVASGKTVAATADVTVNKAVERMCASIEFLKPRLFG